MNRGSKEEREIGSERREERERNMNRGSKEEREI